MRHRGGRARVTESDEFGGGIPPKSWNNAAIARELAGWCWSLAVLNDYTPTNVRMIIRWCR